MISEPRHARRLQADGSTHARTPVRPYLAESNTYEGTSADLPLSVRSFPWPSTTHNLRVESNHQGKQTGYTADISLLNDL